MKIKKAIALLSISCFTFCAFVYSENVFPTKGFPVNSVENPSFDDMVVRHAKRLCNGDLHEIFSQDGRDFIDFWVTANEVNLDLEKVYTCQRLFYNNVKYCELIDYTVVEQVLKMTPQIFEKHFEKKKEKGNQFGFIRDNVEDLMLNRFTQNLDHFQSEPDIFITKLSKDITGIVKSRLTMIRQEEEEQNFKEKLRNIIVRFADMIVNKLIWYENDYQRIWPSFISIADHLHTIGIRGIIDDQDNLDELWDSLVKRFVWYLDLKGSVLPVEFYKQIEEDLKNNVVFFLEVEQDEGIKTKKEVVAQAVIKAKAKSIAYERNGLITDQIGQIGLS